MKIFLIILFLISSEVRAANLAPNLGTNPFPFAQGFLKKDERLCPTLTDAGKVGWLHTWWRNYLKELVPKIKSEYGIFVEKCGRWDAKKQRRDEILGLSGAQATLAKSLHDARDALIHTQRSIDEVLPLLEKLQAQECPKRLEKLKKILSAEIVELGKPTNVECPN